MPFSEQRSIGMLFYACACSCDGAQVAAKLHFVHCCRADKNTVRVFDIFRQAVPALIENIGSFFIYLI
jgi:hypothetical protein